MLITTSGISGDLRSRDALRGWPGLLVTVAHGADGVAAADAAGGADDVVVEYHRTFADTVALFCECVVRLSRVRAGDDTPLAYVAGPVPDALAECARSDDPWEVCSALDEDGRLSYLHLGRAVAGNRLLPDLCAQVLERPTDPETFVRLVEATLSWS